jgi:hypothetical protein
VALEPVALGVFPAARADSLGHNADNDSRIRSFSPRAVKP